MGGLSPDVLDEIDELESQRAERVTQKAEMLSWLNKRPSTPGRVWHSDARSTHVAITHLELEIRKIDAQISALLDGPSWTA